MWAGQPQPLRLTLLACPIGLRTLAPLTLEKGNEHLGKCTRAHGSCGSNRSLEKTTTLAWGCAQDTDWRNGRQQRCCLDESRKEGGSGGGRLTAGTPTSASQGQLCCVNPDQSNAHSPGGLLLLPQADVGVLSRAVPGSLGAEYTENGEATARSSRGRTGARDGVSNQVPLNSLFTLLLWPGCQPPGKGREISRKASVWATGTLPLPDPPSAPPVYSGSRAGAESVLSLPGKGRGRRREARAQQAGPPC